MPRMGSGNGNDLPGPAVVTGAAAGLGEAIARRFAAERRPVGLMDVDAAGLRRVTADIRAMQIECVAITGDVSHRDSVEEFAAAVTHRLGDPEILVNNAAIATDEPLFETTEESWDYQVDSSLKSAFLCTKAFTPSLMRRDSAAICNIGSVNAFLHLGNEAYSAAKAGLTALTRSCAVELGPSNVRVNMVAPGTIRTPSWDHRERSDPAVFSRLTKWFPLGRVGEADDVVEAVLFLCSDRAAWITGAVLVVDGGLTAGNPLLTRELLGHPES